MLSKWSRKRETEAPVPDSKKQAVAEEPGSNNSAILPVMCTDIIKAKSVEDGWMIWNDTKKLTKNMRVEVVIERASKDPQESKHPNPDDLDKREYIVRDSSLAENKGMRVIVHRNRVHRRTPPDDFKCTLNVANDYWMERRGDWKDLDMFASLEKREEEGAPEDGEEEEKVVPDYLRLIGRPILFDKTGTVKLVVYRIDAATKAKSDFHKSMCILAKKTTV